MALTGYVQSSRQSPLTISDDVFQDFQDKLIALQDKRSECECDLRRELYHGKWHKNQKLVLPFEEFDEYYKRWSEKQTSKSEPTEKEAVSSTMEKTEQGIMECLEVAVSKLESKLKNMPFEGEVLSETRGAIRSAVDLLTVNEEKQKIEVPENQKGQLELLWFAGTDGDSLSEVRKGIREAADLLTTEKEGRAMFEEAIENEKAELEKDLRNHVHYLEWQLLPYMWEEAPTEYFKMKSLLDRAEILIFFSDKNIAIWDHPVDLRFYVNKCREVLSKAQLLGMEIHLDQ